MSLKVNFVSSTSIIWCKIGDEMLRGNQLSIDHCLFMSHLVNKGRFPEGTVPISWSVESFVKLDIILTDLSRLIVSN